MDHKKIAIKKFACCDPGVWGHLLGVGGGVVDVNNDVDVDVNDTTKIALPTHKHASIKLLHFFARVENFII